MDNFFIIGVSESERIIRCILCKGSFYPPTNPRPIVQEIPIIIPLCEPDTEKSEKEAKVWQIGSLPEEENEAVLMLIAVRNFSSHFGKFYSFNIKRILIQ